jgi:hypothetical protein
LSSVLSAKRGAEQQLDTGATPLEVEVYPPSRSLSSEGARRGRVYQVNDEVSGARPFRRIFFALRRVRCEKYSG